MKYFGEGLSEQHKKLQHMIRKEQELEAAKELFLSLHAALHASAVSETPCNEVDALLQDLQEYEYAIMPTREAETIAWVIWHIARIEDLTMNMLVARQEHKYHLPQVQLPSLPVHFHRHILPTLFPSWFV